jgi:hypothetical protein
MALDKKAPDRSWQAKVQSPVAQILAKEKDGEAINRALEHIQDRITLKNMPSMLQVDRVALNEKLADLSGTALTTDMDRSHELYNDKETRETIGGIFKIIQNLDNIKGNKGTGAREARADLGAYKKELTADISLIRDVFLGKEIEIE